MTILAIYDTLAIIATKRLSENLKRGLPACLAEMLKRKIRNEEEKKGGARMSDVFSEPQSKFEKEWSCYELLPDADSGVDQLLWWKMHETQFPLLSHMARIVFAVPAASSKSERVFSVAGNTVTPKRACLAPNKVEHLVTIKTNLRLLRQFGSKI